MFKSSKSRQNADGKSEGEKQKQKKRLSFKDPEVEKTSAACKEQQGLSGKPPSLENLSLEDEALRIVRNVGFAFVKPSISSSDSHRSTARTKTTKEPDRDPTNKETYASGERVKLKQDLRTLADGKNREYLEALSPPDPVTMRSPVIEFSAETPVRNADVLSEQQQQRLPTIAHHQIQLLNYQLEQQRQQTQTAMYQIQLLKDQLEAESAARYKAQVHNHQLMMQNKDLLDHIQKLFQQVQNLEKKVESLESKSVVQETKKGTIGQSVGPNQPDHRRGSGSIQQLWSHSSATLSPTSYNQIRRVSATSLLFQDQSDTPGPGESSRRDSVKDETSPRFTSFDTDWRYRRRGSSSYSSAYDLTKNRGNELTVSAEGQKQPSDVSRTRGLSVSIPELKLTMADREGSRSDLGATRETSGSKHLTKGESSTSWTNGQTESSSKGFRPIQAEKKMSTFAEIKGEQKKHTKLLDTLKLFTN